MSSLWLWSVAGIAISKLAVERPLLRQAWKDPNTSDQTIPMESVRELPPVNFSEQTLALIRSENPMQEPSNELSLSKTSMSERWSAMVENLRQSVAQDQSQNENRLHSQIHSWIVAQTQYWRLPESLLLEKINERVYNELFLTPSTDPWLGLQTPDVYTGLSQGGVR